MRHKVYTAQSLYIVPDTPGSLFLFFQLDTRQLGFSSHQLIITWKKLTVLTHREKPLCVKNKLQNVPLLIIYHQRAGEKKH